MLYLSHIIGEDGVRFHQKKIRPILEWPTPKNVMELRGFPGICTYYRRFVRGFGSTPHGFDQERAINMDNWSTGGF